MTLGVFYGSRKLESTVNLEGQPAFSFLSGFTLFSFSTFKGKLSARM
jgi:hypothetical protein